MVYPFKLSVIMPCFNAEHYLDQSLQCLERQWNDKCLEIIFVNDCSTDQTQPKLEAFCKRHPSNTQLINKQKNEGVSQARNDGLHIARGEWITFLDADDALVDGAYQGLCENFLSESISVLSFKTKIIKENNVKDNKILVNQPIPKYTQNEVEWEGKGTDFFLQFHTNTCWIFFYRRQLINKYNVKFRNLSYLEDALFNLDSILHDDVIVRRVNCQIHYWITDHNNSLSTISSRKKNLLMINDLMAALEYMEEMKYRTNEPLIVNRLLWKQNYSADLLIPLLLRCNLNYFRVKQLIKRLKKMNIYPYQNLDTKSKILFFYDMLYRYPILIYFFKPIFVVTDKLR